MRAHQSLAKKSFVTYLRRRTLTKTAIAYSLHRLFRHEALPANPLRARRRAAYKVSDHNILLIACKYRTEYEPNGQILRYLKCMQYHLCQADFGEGEANAEAEQPPVPADGDDPDSAGEDDIPLNESHPDLGNANAGFEEEADEVEEPAAIAMPPPAQQPRNRQAAVQAQDRTAQSQDDTMLPGGSQLVPRATGSLMASGAARRQSKRQGASATAAPSTTRARFN